MAKIKGHYPAGESVWIYSIVEDKAGNSAYSPKYLKFDFTPPTTDID